MNGYEACQNLCKHLEEGAPIKNIDGGDNIFKRVIKEAADRPLMVACSAYVDDSVRKYA